MSADDDVDCWNCDGTGWSFDADGNCVMCDGAGWIVVPASVFSEPTPGQEVSRRDVPEET